MTSPAGPNMQVADMPLEQRFERLAEKYRALKQHYDVTRKLLDEKMQEKIQADQRSSFSSFFSTNTPDPNEMLALKEELEQKILENERLVMDLSHSRQSLHVAEDENRRVRQDAEQLTRRVAETENALEIRVNSEQRLREEFRQLEISGQIISDQRAAALVQVGELKLLLERRDAELRSVHEDLRSSQAAGEQERQRYVELEETNRKLEGQITDHQCTVPKLESETHQTLPSSSPQIQVVSAAALVETDPFTRQTVAQLRAQVGLLSGRNRKLVEELSRAAALVARERIAKDAANENYGTSEKAKARIAEERDTLRAAYEQQMDVLTESLASTRAQLDEIDHLKNACSHCGIVAKCQHAICSDCHSGGFLSRTFFN